MQAAIPITDIGRVIQLSVAPVFLISGVGALLAVLSARLGRTIDRARVLESLICFVIVSLFISALGHFPISIIVGTLFILAMIALIAALLSFMREAFLATRILRIGPR
ncbi:MAG TPA: DUF2721 domain-containing protein [Thermoanaerobaculia bacterium]|jgi:hypothetical protein|nr:DUF2721 domain-containing protein [Thermoanaerobaculia bacterium]